jgi:hypothetical protein
MVERRKKEKHGVDKLSKQQIFQPRKMFGALTLGGVLKKNIGTLY